MKNLMYVPKTFEDWSLFHKTYISSCHCISVTTDCETYVAIEALEQNCLDELTKDLIEIGLTLEVKDYEKTKNCRRKS